MRYEVVIENRVLKSLQRLPRADQERLMRRVEALAEDPRPSGCEKLSGLRDAYRIRQGNYRVVYVIADDEATVLVTRVAHRRDVYRGL